jgi:oligopeptide/dipeptide ABC transporter ATP-binding protein
MTVTLTRDENNMNADTVEALSIRNLYIDVDGPNGPVRVVSGISLEIRSGEKVALVGESGSGKSMTARAIMRLDDDVKLTGSIVAAGVDVTAASAKSLTHFRGRSVGMIFQDPLQALNPLHRIGHQLTEPLRVRGVNKRDAQRTATALLSELGFKDPAARMKAYPHEFSGGMRQRIVIALALIGEPELLIADEPTTALDVRVQKQVLDLLNRVCSQRSLSLLMITHDLAVIANFADRVAVMYAGQIVEEQGVADLFNHPLHPYTKALLDAIPRLDSKPGHLTPLRGAAPSPSARPPGCPFHPRCPAAMDRCSTDEPVMITLGERRRVACHLFDQNAGQAEQGSPDAGDQ